MIYEGKFAGRSDQHNRCLGPEKHPCERSFRFCPRCGAQTLFFKKGLLKSAEQCIAAREDPRTTLTPAEYAALKTNVNS